MFRRYTWGMTKGRLRRNEPKPGPTYLDEMRRLGPRPHESYIAFEMRMAALERGWKLIADGIRTVRRGMTIGEANKAIFKAIKAHESNISSIRRRLGISYELWVAARARAMQGLDIDLTRPDADGGRRRGRPRKAVKKP